MADEDEEQEIREVTDPVKIQEGLIRKAQVLKGNVETFLHRLEAARPLPPYPDMQTRLNALRDAVNDFNAELDKHKDLLSTTVLVPGLTFPARSQMGLLEQLLRTKMEPHVEDWEHQHLEAAHERENRLDREKRGGALTSLSDKDRQELWNWAPQAAQEELKRHVWFTADYTMAEREAGLEHVNHGLQRELIVPELPDSDDDDELFEEMEEEEEDDDEEDAGDQAQKDMDGKAQAQSGSAVTPTLSGRKPMPMDKIQHFMTKGDLP